MKVFACSLFMCLCVCGAGCVCFGVGGVSWKCGNRWRGMLITMMLLSVMMMIMVMFLLMMIQLGVFWCRGSVEIGGAGCPCGCGRCNLEEKLAPSRRGEPDRYLEKGDDDDGADGDAVVSDDDDNIDVDDQYGDKEEAAPYLEGGGCPTAGNQPRNQVCGLAEREHLETDSEIEKLRN